MQRFFIQWVVVSLALASTAWILPGVSVTSWQALFVASLVLGLINATVRPVLAILTLPITVLTLGLFLLVVNGVAFALAAKIVPGFSVGGFGWAMLGALVVSILSGFIGVAGSD